MGNDEGRVGRPFGPDVRLVLLDVLQRGQEEEGWWKGGGGRGRAGGGGQFASRCW